MALPDNPEPLVTKRTEVQVSAAAAQNRQARRKALRAEAKAQRRQGLPPTPIALPARRMLTAEAIPAAEPILELEPGTVVAPVPVAEPEADMPLPPSRALVAARPRGLALVSHRLRSIFGFKRTPAAAVAEGTIAGQLRTLRTELAALQKSIDRMIDGTLA